MGTVVLKSSHATRNLWAVEFRAPSRRDAEAGWGAAFDCLEAKTSLTGAMNRRQGATPCEGTGATAEGGGPLMGRLRITIMSKSRSGGKGGACDDGGRLLGFWKSLDVWATNSCPVEL